MMAAVATEWAAGASTAGRSISAELAEVVVESTVVETTVTIEAVTAGPSAVALPLVEPEPAEFAEGFTCPVDPQERLQCEACQ